LRPRTVKTADAKIIKGGGSGGRSGIANLGCTSCCTLFSAISRIEFGPVSLELPVMASWYPVACALTAVALAVILRRRGAAIHPRRLRTTQRCDSVSSPPAGPLLLGAEGVYWESSISRRFSKVSRDISNSSALRSWLSKG
jgi:hypothetical protein